MTSYLSHVSSNFESFIIRGMAFKKKECWGLTFQCWNQQEVLLSSSDKRLWWILLPVLLAVTAVVFYLKFKSKKVHGDSGMKPLNLDTANSTAKRALNGHPSCVCLPQKPWIPEQRSKSCVLSHLTYSIELFVRPLTTQSPIKPPIDHAPRLLGQGNNSLSEWLAWLVTRQSRGQGVKACSGPLRLATFAKTCSLTLPQRLLPEPAWKHQRWRDAPRREVLRCRWKWWVVSIFIGFAICPKRFFFFFLAKMWLG